MLTRPALQFIARYGVVGAINTAVSYAVYCAFLFLSANYALASLGALAFGSVLSFVTLGRYVFVSRLQGRFPLYVLALIIVYFVNIGLIRLLMSLGADAYLAGLLAAPLTIGTGFLLQKFYVFR